MPTPPGAPPVWPANPSSFRLAAQFAAVRNCGPPCRRAGRSSRCLRCCPRRSAGWLDTKVRCSQGPKGQVDREGKTALIHSPIGRKSQAAETIAPMHLCAFALVQLRLSTTSYLIAAEGEGGPALALDSTLASCFRSHSPKPVVSAPAWPPWVGAVELLDSSGSHSIAVSPR